MAWGDPMAPVRLARCGGLHIFSLLIFNGKAAKHDYGFDGFLGK